MKHLTTKQIEKNLNIAKLQQELAFEKQDERALSRLHSYIVGYIQELNRRGALR